MDDVTPLWAEVDLANIAHNCAQLNKFVGSKVNLVVEVQANGFGCGALPVTQTVRNKGIEWLNVSYTYEGVELRRSGIEGPILVSNPASSEEAGEIVVYSLTPVISSVQIAKAISIASQKSNKLTPMHLNVELDTDSNARIEKTIQLIHEVSSLPSICIEGISYRHSALSEETKEAYEYSFNTFQSILEVLKSKGFSFPYRQGTINDLSFDLSVNLLNLVRAGSMVYGVVEYPLPIRNVVLKPVLSLKSRVLHVHEHKSTNGHTTYDLTANKSKLISTIAFGISHGLGRYLSTEGEVLIKGTRAKIIGRIEMDMYQVDTTHIPDVQVGDEVVIIGQQKEEYIDIEEIAKKGNTIGSEVLCQLSERIPRINKR